MKMVIKMKAVRKYRKHIMAMIRRGLANLRVAKINDGFVLLAQIGADTAKTSGKIVNLFNDRSFSLMKDAINFGVEKFGQKAKKIAKLPGVA